MSSTELRYGKADEKVLDRSVRRRLGALLQPSPGTASEPAALRTRHVGMLAVIAAVNSLAADGFRAASCRTDILLPPGTEEPVLREIEDEIFSAALLTGVGISGGHTEVTAAVARPVVIAHAVGSESYFPEKRRDDPEPGDLLLVIGRIGLEGTFLLEEERREELHRHFSDRFLDRAKRAGEQLLLPPALDALSQLQPLPSCLVHAAGGGIMAALWNLSWRTGAGFRVSLPEIPILQETVELTDWYDINPYELCSEGCMLAVVQKDAGHVCGSLEERGFCARQIGVLTGEKQKLLINGDEVQCLNRPAPEALLPLLG